MKILAIADKESKAYWDFYTPGKLKDIDLIISCGDINPNFLTFLASFTHVPILYVRGNHDDNYKDIPPEGCICIEDKMYIHEGIRILGLGGSVRYKVGDNQYEQKEMEFRVKKLWFQLLKHKGIDILVTHSPAYGIGDGDDRPHKGFHAFNKLLNKYSPKYFLHGHVHTTYGRQFKRHKTYNDTLIINPYETYLFEYETEYDDQFQKIRERELNEKMEMMSQKEDNGGQ